MSELGQLIHDAIEASEKDLAALRRLHIYEPQRRLDLVQTKLKEAAYWLLDEHELPDPGLSRATLGGLREAINDRKIIFAGEQEKEIILKLLDYHIRQGTAAELRTIMGLRDKLDRIRDGEPVEEVWPGPERDTKDAS